MDEKKLKLTQTNGSGNEMRITRQYQSENNGIESVSSIKNLKDPHGNISSTDDSVSRDFKRRVGRFFYSSGAEFHAVELSSFEDMATFVSKKMKDCIPTAQELGGWILAEEAKEMHEYVNEIRNSWPDTGCSILLDGWMDKKKRNFINILVDCPKGTVYLRSADISHFIGNVNRMFLFLEEVLLDVGIENVVQIVTYSTSTFMQEVGKQLMEKYRPIFWSVSASCCIELMLEKMMTLDVIKETLEKAKTIIRFFHGRSDLLKLLQDSTGGNDLIKPSYSTSTRPFLILESIVSEKEALKRLFSSFNSKNSILASSNGGIPVANLVGTQSFWSGAVKTLKAAIPLVRVFELMYENSKAKLGYIYETIDQVKETIKKEFQNKKSEYMPFWKIIDDIWNENLHSHLHSAGYFLNPNLFYSSDVYIDPEVVCGLFCCIVRSTEDLHVQDLITMQMEDYRKAKGSFGVGSAIGQRSNIPPALWWSTYGAEYPELQKLAIRILSQTCDGASKFPLTRSLVEDHIFLGDHTSKFPLTRSLVEERIFLGDHTQLTLKSSAVLIYVNHNLNLKKFSARRRYNFDSVDVW